MKRTHKPFDVRAALKGNPGLAKLNQDLAFVGSAFLRHAVDQMQATRLDFTKETKKDAPKANVELKKAIKVSQGNKLKARFESMWNLCAGPMLELEFRFHHERMFRFDYCLKGRKVAIELEGGIWRKQGGAHSGGVAANRDCVKYNLAAVNGWTVFRLTTDLIDAENIQPIVNFCKVGPI